MGLEVVKALAYRAIAARFFATGKLSDWGVNANPEDVKWCEESLQINGPGLLFDDVLNQEIIAGGGECSNGTMKAMEKAVAPRCTGFRLGWAKARIGKLVGRLVAERWIKGRAEGNGEERLPGA